MVRCDLCNGRKQLLDPRGRWVKCIMCADQPSARPRKEENKDDR